MISEKRNLNNLPLMAEEEVHLSFGARHGLEAEAGMDQNTMVLTDRRLIRLSRMGSSWDVAFISLEDAQVAEVRITPRGKRSLLRVALLLAGAGAALASIGFRPIALALAAVLGMGAGYHLFHYLTVSHEGSILFRTGHAEVEMSFQGDMTDQAYTFVNRFSQMKASSAPAPKVGEEEQMEPEAPLRQGWQGTDEVEIEPMIGQGDGSPVEAHEEDFPQEEHARRFDEEADPS
ncbi:MAG: hypothetical protein ABID84_06080 [Chloroflexota bacterium]